MTLRKVKYVFKSESEVTTAIFPAFDRRQLGLLGALERPEWHYVARLVRIRDDLFWASLTKAEQVVLEKTNQQKITAERVTRIMKAGAGCTDNIQAESRLSEFTFHYDGYAEPGYKDPDSGCICTGNYNTITKWDQSQNKSVVVDDTPKRVGDLLSEAGVELEWCDEWQECSHCYKLVRTTGDSYRWKRAFVEFQDECVCHECIATEESLRESYLESLEGEHSNCLTLEDLDLHANGYRLLKDDFEHGFHPGQDASPELVAKLLRQVGCERFLFRLDSTGQFDISFSVWLHKSERKLFKKAQRALESGKTDGPSVSEGLRRGLQAASAAMQPQVAGVQHISVDVEKGTATSRLISPQDFIEKGIKE